MGFNLTDNDKRIADSDVIMFLGDDVQPIDGFVNNELLIFFQFPPILKNDSKDNKWETIDKVAYEPSYTYMGAQPRTISMFITYVVGGPPLRLKEANAINISNEVRKIRSYFYTAGPDAVGKLPVFILQMYNHINSPPTALRGLSMTASYSDALIRDSSGVFPIKTEITLNLTTVTNIASDDGEKQHQHSNIPDNPKQAWY